MNLESITNLKNLDILSLNNSNVVPRGATASEIRCAKCLVIRLKLFEIQPEIPAIRKSDQKSLIFGLKTLKFDVIPKILEILKIRRDNPGIWPETLQIRPQILKLCPEIHETRLRIAKIPDSRPEFLEIGPKTVKLTLNP